MKKVRLKMVLVVFLLLLCGRIPVSAQAAEIAQLALNVEKLAQLKSILTTLKKGFEVVSKGYGTVKSLTQGNFNLHKVFIDGLMQVSPAVKNYPKVAGIIDFQIQLVKEFKVVGKRFGNTELFNPREIEYMLGVYENIAGSSMDNLDELLNVITADKLRMSDDERLAAIDKIYADLEDKVNFLRHFKGSCSMLALSRTKAKNQIKSSVSLHGIKE